MKRPYHFAFIMDQQVGLRTQSLNLQRVVAADDSIEANWIAITYQFQQSWLPALPDSVRGTITGIREIQRSLSGDHGFDGILWATWAAKYAPQYFRSMPAYLVMDMTPRQMEEMGEHYGYSHARARFFGAWKKQATLRIYRQAKYIFAWNQWVADSLRRDYGVPNEKISVVSPGVDVELFHPDASVKAHDGVMRILFVGGDFQRKGGDLLLRWARETGIAAKWELHLVTRDAVPETPGVVVHHGLTNNSPELIRLYQQCDLFVLPTRGDCYSLVALEAMATGLPVIISRLGGIPEIVVEGETGYLIDPDDEKSLFSTLESLVCNSDLRRTMGMQARQRVVEHFDCRTNMGRILSSMKIQAQIYHRRSGQPGPQNELVASAETPHKEATPALQAMAVEAPGTPPPTPVPGYHRVNIIVDNGSYGMQNHGDVSMLMIAVERLNNLWPGANIQVITDRPVRLRRACPVAVPLPTYGHLIGKLHYLVPKLSKVILDQRPHLALLIIKSMTRLGRRYAPPRDMKAYAEWIAGADLVLASGGGYMTDSFAFYAEPILETLQIAAEMGKTTAILGQGLGPFNDAELVKTVKTVLPKIDRIALREQRVGPSLLHDLNVPEERVLVTGDDAVELAYRLHPPTLGNCIGVNVRRMAYAGIDDQIIAKLAPILHQASRDYQAPLVPLPISVSKVERDDLAIQHLLRGHDDTSDGGASLRSPLDVIREVGKCRMIVTGSYHAAVFALSSGVPSVCIVKTKYYADKFLGLADQFGVGSRVLVLEDSGFESNVAEAIAEMWRTAEDVRPALLAAARRQIAAGHESYQRIYELVEQRLAQK